MYCVCIAEVVSMNVLQTYRCMYLERKLQIHAEYIWMRNLSQRYMGYIWIRLEYVHLNAIHVSKRIQMYRGKTVLIRGKTVLFPQQTSRGHVSVLPPWVIWSFSLFILDPWLLWAAPGPKAKEKTGTSHGGGASGLSTQAPKPPWAATGQQRGGQPITSAWVI